MKKPLLIGIAAAAVIAIGFVLAIVAANNKSTPPASNTQPSSSNTSTAPSNSSSSQSSDSQSTTANQVTIHDMLFAPSQITVKKGTKVTWKNDDSVAHTVTADSGSGPNSDSIDPGSSYSYTFDTAGSFQYHCTFHSAMHGTIVVQ
jgi:plastocyanin